MEQDSIMGAVRRALKNISRAHNATRSEQKTTAYALEIAYNNLPGTPKERIHQIRQHLRGELQIRKEAAERSGVKYRTSEVRAASKPMVLEGYAALYNEPTDLGAFREMIAPGAFAEVLEDDVRLLLNHDGAPLARTKNGTLELSDDDKGLLYRAELIDTQAGRDLYAMVQRGDITQSSFGFTIERQEIQEDGLRVITKVGRLLDVSPVTYPAYEATEVYARASRPDQEPSDT
jgi:HK97 family phage prohead protease